MNDLNTVTITGHIGADAEVRQAGDAKVASFRLAVNRRWKDAEGKDMEAVDWIDVEAWKGLSEIAEKYAKKGRKVLINGLLRQDTWETDGKKRSRILIVARHLDVRLPQQNGK